MIRPAKPVTLPIFSQAGVIPQPTTQPPSPPGHSFGHKCSVRCKATEPRQGVGAHGAQDK